MEMSNLNDVMYTEIMEKTHVQSARLNTSEPDFEMMLPQLNAKFQLIIYGILAKPRHLEVGIFMRQ